MTVYKKIFLDTAPVIYYLERIQPYFLIIRDIIFSGLKSGAGFYTSTITNTEYLVVPFREKNLLKVRNFETFKKLLTVNVTDIDDRISITAAKIRAEYGSIKGMDALQIAACIETGCDVFVTNDKQLLQISEINPVLISGKN